MTYIRSSANGKPFTWADLRKFCDKMNLRLSREEQITLSSSTCNKFLYAMELPYQPYPCECGRDIWKMCHAIPAKG